MSRLAPWLIALPLALAAPAAWAQDPHAGHHMPAAPADPHAGHAMPAAPDPHAGHMPQVPADPQTGHAMPREAEGTGAALPVGDAAPPPPPASPAADQVFDPAAMRRARAVLRAEHGGGRAWQVMAERAEYRVGHGGGYHWDGEAWYGGDLNRLVLETEGEGGEDGVESAELQVLYARAVGPYTDLRLGLRQNFEPEARTYATVGVETLLPYWIEAEAALFLSERGDVLARLEAEYDWRLTQRLVLQPSVELTLAGQDVPDLGVRAGVSSAEVGLRLRYEVRRRFAPYVGVVHERRFGETADLARAAGEEAGDTRATVGLRAWF